MSRLQCTRFVAMLPSMAWSGVFSQVLEKAKSPDGWLEGPLLSRNPPIIALNAPVLSHPAVSTHFVAMAFCLIMPSPILSHCGTRFVAYTTPTSSQCSTRFVALGHYNTLIPNG